ncbi:hypothetical protein B0H14DRAFT_2966094 [Mycena olivaceomarginata]|nr:hypothetical protein B0H14DRAFT_2966094 [Mycena olivaceomarginata]
MMGRLRPASSSVVEWFVLSLKTSLVHCHPKKTWSSKSADRISWTQSMAKLRTPHWNAKTLIRNTRRWPEERKDQCKMTERELGLLVAES